MGAFLERAGTTSQMPAMINLVLCGGSGTRLWPLSRSERPKQFVPLFQGRTLFEETLLRNRPHCQTFLVAVSEPLLGLALEQAKTAGVVLSGGVVEPMGRNTAPAIALACLGLDPDAIVLVSPSDHIITRAEEYGKAVARAAELAAQGTLVTFGLKPQHPETGYGYIEADGERVISFHEKPDQATADRYVSSGRYLWNSGMFVFRAGVFLEELKIHAPEVWERCRAPGFDAFFRPSRDEMSAIPSVSIDVAVMQKSSRVAVVPCDLGWSDLGSFEAVFGSVGTERGDNLVLNDGNVEFHNSARNLVAAGERRVTLMNVNDLLIVDVNDELLIARRGTNPASKA